MRGVKWRNGGRSRLAFLFTVWGSVAFVAGSSLLPLAALVYATRPDRDQNRYLALFLFASGLFVMFWWGARGLVDDPRTAWAIGVAATVPYFPMWVGYLFFLGALDSSAGRFLRDRRVRGAILAFYGSSLALLLAAPDLFFPGVVPFQSIGGYELGHGPARSVMLLQGFAVFLLSLGVSIQHFRRARGGASHRQARVLLIGFGVLNLAGLLWLGHRALGFPGLDGYGRELALTVPVALFFTWLGIVLAYGILTAQLFDIDLKMKWTVRQAVRGTLFVGAFFLASKAAEVVFEAALGAVLGLLVAFLFAFVLAPAQRLVEQVAERAMPGVRVDPGYVHHRKQEVYRAAIDGALVDGGITNRERAVLQAIARKLEIEEGEAAHIEREARAAGGAIA